MLTSGAPIETEVRVLGKDGHYRWFLERINALRDERGTVLRCYRTRTDIDDRKRAEQRLEKENVALREEIDNTSMFEEIVAHSAALRAVLGRVAKVAPTESTVLITGETGTGKELIARAIHKRSRRAGRAFVSVNCAAIPQTLITSELFGHEKGAFTGALQRRLGNHRRSAASAARRCRSRSRRSFAAPEYPPHPGTSSVAHLRENLAAAELDLPNDAVTALDGIAAGGGSLQIRWRVAGGPVRVRDRPCARSRLWA